MQKGERTMSTPAAQHPPEFVNLKLFTKQDVAERIRYQLEEYQNAELPAEAVTSELEYVAPGLAQRVADMKPEEAAPLYLAARMIRECSLLIMQQATVSDLS